MKMICPICDRAITKDEVLMLTHDNRVNHSGWDMDGQTWFTYHESKPNEYQVSIDWSNKND